MTSIDYCDLLLRFVNALSKVKVHKEKVLEVHEVENARIIWVREIQERRIRKRTCQHSKAEDLPPLYANFANLLWMAI